METKELIEKAVNTFKGEILMKETFIKETINSSSQFETNHRNTFTLKYLKKNLEYIEQWKGNIGKQVYKFLNRENYTLEKNQDVLNKIDETPILFTEELYEKLVIRMLNYWKDYHTEDLLTRSIIMSSTNKLDNIKFEWVLDEKQQLIKLYNKLLGNDNY